MGLGCSSAAEPTYVPIEGGCPICDNRPSKDATWAEKFEVTHERLQHLAKLDEKTSFCGTFPGLVDLLTAQTTSDVEQFWVLFQWVQREGRRQQPRKSLPGDSPFEFLRAVKDGKRSYADLYKKLCSTAGLKCKTVTGHCKSSAERGDITPKSSWNVVTIDGRRALVDCQFELSFKPNRMPPECYFFSLPTHFATTHFPDDRSHQLLQGSVMLAQFRRHDTLSCVTSFRRGQVTAEGYPVQNEATSEGTKEERQTSGTSSEAESMEDHNSDLKMTLGELKDTRLKPLPKGCSHHIMISYCHKQQKKVAKIRKHLDKVGYKVWIDKERMAGTLASSMARAINGTAIVLFALSNDYVKSDYCKKEAIYANEQKKKIIPLKMEDYKLESDVDDWLGIVITGLLRVDFSSTQSFNDQLESLESQIEYRLKQLRDAEINENV